MVFFSALAGLGAVAGSFIRDLVTGKQAGTSLADIGQGAVKIGKDIGGHIFKGVKKVFGAPSFGEGFKELGNIAKNVGGEVGKAVETGSKFLDIGKIIGQVAGADTTAIDVAKEEGAKLGGVVKNKLFEIGSGAGDISGILGTIGGGI